MTDLVPIRRARGMGVVATFVNEEGWALHGSHWEQAAPFLRFDGEFTKEELELMAELWVKVFYPATIAGRTLAEMKERNAR